MKKVFTGLLLTLSLNLLAINKQDSLLNILKEADSDSAKIDLYYKLSNTTIGETKLDYLKKIIKLDKKYDHKYLGYKPFFNIAYINISNNNDDSVKYYLDKSMFYAKKQNDSVGIAKTYHSFSTYNRFIGEYSKTISYSKKAREIYKCLNDSFSYYRLLSNEAFSNYGIGEIPQAEKLFKIVIDEAKHPRDSWIIAASNLGMGSIMKDKNDYDNALQYYLDAYNIWKDLNDSVYFCRALNNIGLIYKDISMQSMALSSFNEIIDINPKDDPYALPLALANISTIYSNRKEFEKAYASIDLAIQKMDTIGNLFYHMSLKHIKSQILIDDGKYEEAKPLTEDVIQIAKEHDFNNKYHSALNQYADILYNTQKYNDALTHAQRALSYAKKNSDIKDLFSNNYLIGKILNKQNKPTLASSYLLKSLEYNDSLKKEEQLNNINEAAIKYELGKRDAINESLKKETELNKTIIEKTQAIVKLQKFYIIIIALFFLFSLFFLFIVLRNSRIRKHLNKKLSTSNKEIQDKNNKLHELININSKIFSIISHDLKAPIISLQYSLTLLNDENLDKNQKEKLYKSTEVQVDSTIELLENLLRWSKTHTNSIKLKLENIDICNAVNTNLNLIKTASLNKEIHIINECDQHVKIISDIDLINMVLRNLLSNAIKFTPRDGTIKITLKSSTKNNSVILSVIDSGIGISENDIKKIMSKDEFLTTNGTDNETGSGLGLKLCHNYIQYMGGNFYINSKPGKGSTFSIELPTPHAK